MTVRELLKVLTDYDVQVNIKTHKNYNEEIESIDVWSVDYFEHFDEHFGKGKKEN